MTGALSVAGIVFLAALLPPGFSAAQAPSLRPADAGQGRTIFNGKGICHYCHGTDGYPARRPQLNQATTAFIDRLDPKPADLRKPGGLKLQTDAERFRAIREGHPGTGMFPDTTLTDEEIRDALAYLATLRDTAKDPP